MDKVITLNTHKTYSSGELIFHRCHFFILCAQTTNLYDMLKALKKCRSSAVLDVSSCANIAHAECPADNVVHPYEGKIFL